ncbi:MAG: hypothetical protein ACUVSK_01630, partial [Desulfotomaculales bacterium]
FVAIAKYFQQKAYQQSLIKKSHTKPFFFSSFPGDDYNLDTMLYNNWTAYMEVCFQASFFTGKQILPACFELSKTWSIFEGKKGDRGREF